MSCSSDHTDADAALLDMDGVREEAIRLLGVAIHYADLAQGHLQISDDAGALWDLTLFREHAIKALQRFKPVQAAMKERVRQSHLEATQ